MSARGLALVALALAAGVVTGVVSAGGSSPSRQAQLRTAVRTVTVTRATTVAPSQSLAAKATRPATITGTPVTFVPVNVRRFGLTTEIPARWQVTTQEYAQRQRVTVSGPAGQAIVIDRTASAPSPAQIDHGYRTVSLAPWRGADVSGSLWRFAASFCAPVCSDWLGASRHAGYAVLIDSSDPTLVREAMVVATRLQDGR